MYVNDNAHHHVVVVYDLNGTYLYIDGVLDSYNSDGGNLNTIQGFTIGSDINKTVSFDGIIDDVNIWNYPLTEDEIQNLNVTGDEEGLVANWKFNQGSDGDYPDILIDYSGNDSLDS